MANNGRDINGSVWVGQLNEKAGQPPITPPASKAIIIGAGGVSVFLWIGHARTP